MMMKRWIAFLRGINVGGKNKIAMAELKAGFAQLGFADVQTYLNSGNVAFSEGSGDGADLSARIRAMLNGRFALDVPVMVLPKDELEDILRNAPDWWGNEDKEIYDNLIFLLPPTTFAEVLAAIGAPKEGLERIQNYKSAIFWSFSRKDYQKTNWWAKTAAADIGGRLTIRTAGTLRKIVGM